MKFLWSIIGSVLLVSLVQGYSYNKAEPNFYLAFLEEQIAGIGNLPEEEKFLHLSYTTLINSQYRYIVQQMIISQTKLQRMAEQGKSVEDPAYQREFKEIERYKENLRRETKRFLDYAELHLDVGREAQQELKRSTVNWYLRYEYFNLYFDKFLLDELLKMPEEDRFFYLSDNGPVNLGYRQLVEEIIINRFSSPKIRSEWTGNEEKQMQAAEVRVEGIKKGLRKETDRILKYLVGRIVIKEKALITATKNLEDEDLKQKPRI